MSITIRSILARLASALDCWRNEPDPATVDPADDDLPDDEPLPDDATPEQEADIAARYAQRRQHYQDRENAIAAGLVMAGGAWDGRAAIQAVQGMILADIHHDYRRRVWGDQLN